MPKTALVTGGSGFVGAHMVTALLNDGYQVYAVDIKNGEDVLDLFRNEDHRYDLVVHAAAIVGGRDTIENRPLVQLVDFELDSLCVQYCARTKPGRLVLLSSSAVYPSRLQGPAAARASRRLMESDVFINDIEQPDPSLYGLLKLSLEYIAQFLPDIGVPVTIVRPFSGYGDDQDLTYPFPSIIKRVADGDDPVVVWGSGHQVRDFIHIDDIVEQILFLVRHWVDGPINLCTGIPTSFNDLALYAMEEAGLPVRIRNEVDRPSGVQYRVGDPTMINALWPARISIREGIVRALEEYDRAGA
jgi:nucleoside-diphosphate-sugar epimerase